MYLIAQRFVMIIMNRTVKILINNLKAGIGSCDEVTSVNYNLFLSRADLIR